MIRRDMTDRFLVLTPGLDGADGIARVSCLVVQALGAPGANAPSAAARNADEAAPPLVDVLAVDRALVKTEVSADDCAPVWPGGGAPGRPPGCGPARP